MSKTQRLALLVASLQRFTGPVWFDLRLNTTVNLANRTSLVEQTEWMRFK